MTIVESDTLSPYRQTEVVTGCKIDEVALHQIGISFGVNCRECQFIKQA